MEDEELTDEPDLDGDEEVVEAEPGEVPEPGPDDPAVESSLDELIAKRAPEEKPAEEEEDESLLTLERDERVESLAVKVVPPQANEFTCKNCFLVKHRSQLADKRRMFCVDCA
jgi:uncharacterized protein DUF4193